MQPAFHTLARTLVVLACVLASAQAWSGDLRRFPDPATVPEAAELDAAEVEQLKDLVRIAEELERARASANASGEDESATGEAAPAAPSAVPGPDAGISKAEKDAGKNDAGKKREAEARKPANRSGCMYRDRTLIWEKVPGTCSR
jgi:hypothetical protein